MIKQIKKDLKEKNGFERELEAKNIGKELLEAGVSITTIISNITELLSPSNVLVKSLLLLIK